MIKDQDRLWFHCADLPVGWGTAVYDVLDFDTRKWFMLEGPTEVFGDVDDDGAEIFSAFLPVVDTLGPDVNRVCFAADKTVQAISGDPADDVTRFVYYPLLTTEEAGEDALHCLQRTQLKELDHLDIHIDLVTPITGTEILVFKYELLRIRLEALWREAFLLKRLKGCPHVVPFYKFIVDDVEPRFLGFTTKFIPGGTLEDIKRPFRKDWLLQLLSFVDNLNLHYGIVHQDIAPRNLLVDPATNLLTVIDFGQAAQIGSEREFKPSNDIDGVLYAVYEILTQDFQFTDNVRPEDYNVEDITSMETWPLKVELESGLDIQTLRSIVTDWATDRKRKQATSPSTPAQNLPSQNLFDTLPPMPSTAVDKVIVNGEHWEYHDTYPFRNMVSTGERIVRWERAPQSQWGKEAGKQGETERWDEKDGDEKEGDEKDGHEKEERKKEGDEKREDGESGDGERGDKKRIRLTTEQKET